MADQQSPWPTRPLGDVLEVKHGFAFEGQYFVQDGPYRLLTPGNFSEAGGFVDRGANQKHYDGPVPSDYVLTPGSLLVAMTEQSEGLLGSAALVPVGGRQCLHNQRLGLVRTKPGAELDLRFAYYLFNNRPVRQQISAKATGTKIRHTSPRTILSVVAPIPPLAAQQVIASFLCALDDKIELNRRMNETLEAMAQAIFRDWFVDFRPTRRKLAGIADPIEIIGDLVQDPARAATLAALFPAMLGGNGLPEGWYLCAAETLIEFNPSEPLKKGSVAPYADMSSLPTSGSTAEPPILREFGSGMKFKNGDALIARITPCLENGKAAFVDFLPEDTTVGWGSTEFIVLRSRPPVPSPFAYLLVRHPEFKSRAIQSMTGTSGRQRAQAEPLKAFELCSATPEVFSEFGRLTIPIFAKITGNALQNQTLAATRDLLLPKLMSGEIRLREAEAMVEGAT